MQSVQIDLGLLFWQDNATVDFDYKFLLLGLFKDCEFTQHTMARL
jgi:hypothetical protein